MSNVWHVQEKNSKSFVIVVRINPILKPIKRAHLSGGCRWVGSIILGLRSHGGYQLWHIIEPLKFCLRYSTCELHFQTASTESFCLLPSLPVQLTAACAVQQKKKIYLTPWTPRLFISPYSSWPVLHQFWFLTPKMFWDLINSFFNYFIIISLCRIPLQVVACWMVFVI